MPMNSKCEESYCYLLICMTFIPANANDLLRITKIPIRYF